MSISPGCDTVPKMFRIGKKKALTAVRKIQLIKELYAKIFNKSLILWQRPKLSWLLVSAVKRRVLQKTGHFSGGKAVTQKATSKGIDLKSLSPTIEGLELNIQHTRFQLMLWYSSLDDPSPNLDPQKIFFLFIGN